MSAAAALGPRFPATVFRHPLLAALDARGRAELESAGHLRAVRAGEALFTAGEPADALFVVVSGEIALRAGGRRAELRRVSAGDAVGEEAAARAHATRRHDATAATDAELAAIPAPLLRRVMARAEGHGPEASAAGRTRRWLLRALASDALERCDFSRDLPPRARDLMLDAGRAIELRRGEPLHREGDASNDVYFLAEGMVQSRGQDEKRVLAYHKAGDFFGDEALEEKPRESAATAMSDVWIFAVRAEVARDLAAAHPSALDKALRVRTAARARQQRVQDGATRHVLADLHRFETSRSLLAIDQERCLRCGACAWSCGAVHDDGVSRLLRRGDVVVAKVRGEARTLLLPSSCQHCKNPACMIDCPTGAITRDARGEVQIREELCTGCGSCAKACPWDNIQMAPRSARHLPIVRTEAAVVAVKCDLCRDRGGEPACVAACPADAIARIDPGVELDDVRAVLDRREGPAQATKRSRVPAAIVASAALVAAGAATSGMSRTTSGVLLLACVAALFAYAGIKRFGIRLRSLAVRPHFLAHVAIGTVSLGLALAHARGHSALALAFWGAALLGAFAGACGAIVPRRLARIERNALLPEEIPEALARIDARLFRDLSGKSDLLKGLYQRVLRPFSRSPLVLASVCALGTPQRALRERLTARIFALVPQGDERLAGLEGIVSIAAERQALRAQRLLTLALRASAFAHVVVAAALAVLVVVHVFLQVRGR